MAGPGDFDVLFIVRAAIGGMFFGRILSGFRGDFLAKLPLFDERSVTKDIEVLVSQ